MDAMRAATIWQVVSACYYGHLKLRDEKVYANEGTELQNPRWVVKNRLLEKAHFVFDVY